MRKPQDFATNVDYSVSAGAPYTGTPTKVAPSGAVTADGFVPDTAVGMQHLNHLANANGQVGLGVWHSQHFGFRELPAAESDVTSATRAGHFYFLCVGGLLRLLGHGDILYEDITPSALTAQGVAHDPASDTLVVVGAHATNMGSSSIDRGANFVAITDFTDDFESIVWDASNGLFIASGATTHIATSATGLDSSWTSRTPGTEMAEVAFQMVTHEGTTLRAIEHPPGAGDTDEVWVDVSTNGTSWTASLALTVSGNDAFLQGIAVDPINERYAIAVWNSGTSGVETWTAPFSDPTTWTSRSSLPNQSNIDTYSFCADSSGNLILGGANLTGSTSVNGILVSSDGGVTWSDEYPISFFGFGGGDNVHVVCTGDRIFVGFDDGATDRVYSNLIF